MKKHEYGSIEYNPYHECYIVTLETAAYHNGKLAGTGLGAQLEQMNQRMVVCSPFGLARFPSRGAAAEWCRNHGVQPYYGTVVYHVSGTYELRGER